MITAKCPSCDKNISNVNLGAGPLGNSLTGPLVAGFVATCPSCRAVLGVLPDPDAIAAKVAAKLTGKRS